FGRGAWSRAAPAPAAGDHYELVWTRLSAGDESQPIFRFAWMLFGEPPFDITWYRGADGFGSFEPIPGYALTRTSVRTPAPGAKTVAIKLNATDVEIPVFWQVGDLELGSYDCGPLVGYRVTGSILPPRGATFPAISFDRTTAPARIRVGDKTVDICLAGKDVGLVSLRSGDTPSTVIWGGSTLRITAVAPPERIWADDREGQDGADNPNRGTTSTYWSDYIRRAVDPITGRPVNLVTGDQLRIPGVDLGIQYMGYGTAFEGRPRETRVVAYSNDPDNRAHRPFIKMFEFQNVSARITDFNGRPLPGAFYQLVDAQTGKSAAWSYAGPDGRIVPMPIRKPGGVFIQRVNYLGIGANGDPTWPVNSFAKWPIAYDSRDDETTQETQKPDIPLGFAYTAEAGPWPNGDGWRQETFRGRRICELAGDFYYPYSTAFLEILASCPPAGWGRSFDVITRIFDLRIRFVYGDAQRPADPAYVFSAPSLALPERFNIAGQGSIVEVRRIARGTYDIVALWPGPGGAEVGRRTFDVSRANVGTVEGTVVLALRDISFAVVDRQGRPLSGARVSVAPNLVRDDDVQLRPDSIFTILRVPDGRTYDFTVEWTSVYGTTARAAVRDSPAGLQSRGSITIPVDDITIKVVDFDDRPVAGAQITFGGQAVGATDSMGVLIVGQVPLDNEYAISVRKEGTEIGSDRVRFTASRLSATLQAGVYDITVLVRGAAGQPIQGATVQLVRGGTPIATTSTDSSGAAVFSKVVGADYTVSATYEQFSQSANVARGVRSATITLDLYTVLLGVPMTFATFLALIIGLILLVIVVVVIVSEYIRWRGRRLGIYPAAPPKK
ncbi:MAG: carboxypeptidase-like regulatory domain-containing protein, partial [Candidatus Caldarchaeum sp.]|nr:carboxypeptidase-like regulatory domain-containing protein [Candidatus Caldarchaeum sp.]MDW8434918.1 carboxypeptidase-like regulatory domain-containing protein [Candidatus Caldarchaeum sp.]